MDVYGSLVTRGNVDISQILAVLMFHGFPGTVWDNSKSLDFKVFGRYVIGGRRNELIFTQDDDVLVSNPTFIINAWEPGKVVCNMPTSAPYRANYPGPEQLVGFGAVFERSLVKKTFDRYFAKWPLDDLAMREADRIFTTMNTCKLVDVRIEHLPWADGPDRMYKEPGHNERRREAVRRAMAAM